MKITKQQIVTNRLKQMELGDKLDKKKFVREHWEYCDFFTQRIFDVFFCKGKKEMPERSFKVKKGIVERIK